MIYKEEVRDLFSVPEEYYLAHCISADFGMGKGIVVEFNNRFNMKEVLQRKYPDFLNQWRYRGTRGDCILEGRVLNLVTKEQYFQKPTYTSMWCALNAMRTILCYHNIRKIAMPIIGCGLDKLEWSKVSDTIRDVFGDMDVEILVCRQE